jgi:hypothetical protein
LQWHAGLNLQIVKEGIAVSEQFDGAADNRSRSYCAGRVGGIEFSEPCLPDFLPSLQVLFLPAPTLAALHGCGKRDRPLPAAFRSAAPVCRYCFAREDIDCGLDNLAVILLEAD